MSWNGVKRRVTLASVAITAISIAATATTAPVALAGTTNGPVWQSQQTGIAGLASFKTGSIGSATCTGPGRCVAVGGEVTAVTGGALVLASSNGSWGAPATAEVNDGAGGYYSSVACESASACVGVGLSVDGVNPTATKPIAGSIAVSGSTVTPAAANVLPVPSVYSTDPAGDPELAALTSVSCTASSCTAVGYADQSGYNFPLVYTNEGSGWVLSLPTPPSAAAEGANLTAVSCPSDGPCEAVGYYVDSSGDSYSWAVQLSGSQQGVTITPPSDAIVNPVAQVVTSPADPPGLYLDMSGISCPSASACTAVGNYLSSTSTYVAPMAVKIDNGVAGTATALPQPAAAPTPATNSVSGVWCADASDCTVNGKTITDPNGGGFEFLPVSGYESAGTWSPLSPLPGAETSAGASLSGLGCSALSDCVSVGTDGVNGADGVNEAPIFSFSAAPLSVTSATLAAATVGEPYNATLPSSGGANAQDWTIAGGALPAGLILNAATGVISGTPTAAGTATFTAQLADGPPAQVASADFSITVAAASSVPSNPVAGSAASTAPSVPAVPAAGTAALSVAKVTARSVTLKVRCAGSASCQGSAMVTAVEHFRGTKLKGITAHIKQKLVKITLAHGNYSVSGGEVRSVTLKLTAKAMALLKRLHELRGTLTLTPAGANKPAASRPVTFKMAVKKKTTEKKKKKKK
jgi:hypothetical protein